MTTTEIAKKLNISRGTVSRVINCHPNVKPETRRIVLEELATSGYIPNEAARSLVMKRSHRIAVIVFSEPVFFWDQVRFGVSYAESQLKVLGVTADFYVTDILHPAEQLELLRRLPGEGYDAIAVAPNEPGLLTQEINNLTQNGVPVLLLNVDVPGTDRLCYVGCDYQQAGALAAEILAHTLPETGEVAVLGLEEAVVSIEQRITGFTRALSGFTHAPITEVMRFDRKAKGVYGAVCGLLSRNPRIHGIFVALGALEQTAQAVLDMGQCGRISLVGYDLSHEIFGYMKKGAVTATICHEPFNQGYYAVKVLHNYLLTRAVPAHAELFCRLEAIFSGNAQYHLDYQDHMELLKLR